MAPDGSAPVSKWNIASTSDVNREPKWTVMVFMGADTIEGNEPLDDAANADLDEIKSIGGAITLDIFVEVHRSVRPTRRYHFGFDGDKKTVTEEEIPGAGAEYALIKFIEESIDKSDHRRDDHSILVLWGHAYDFAFAPARTREGVVDAIDFVELSGMLQRLQDIMKVRYRERYGDVSEERPTLDIIGFDACDVSTVEIACELQPFAKYLLGSEIGIPIPGWPYDRILDRLNHPFGRLMAPPEFGSYVVRRFCESYPASTPVSLTLLDLSQATGLRKRAELLALALTAAIDDPGYRDRITELFIRSQTGEGRPYVDVVDLCLNLRRESGDPIVTEVASALGDLLLSPGPKVVGNSHTGEGRPLIVDHGRNAGELARLNGISLYAPHVASNEFEAVRSLYDQFVFARGTMWSALVHLLAKQS
jgi:Clostripain family